MYEGNMIIVKAEYLERLVDEAKNLKHKSIRELGRLMGKKAVLENGEELSTYIIKDRFISAVEDDWGNKLGIKAVENSLKAAQLVVSASEDVDETTRKLRNQKSESTVAVAIKTVQEHRRMLRKTKL